MIRLLRFALTVLASPFNSKLQLEAENTVFRHQLDTLRNWRSMRVGPSFVKIGKAILYPLEELDRWDRINLVVCRPSRSLPLEDAVS